MTWPQLPQAPLSSSAALGGNVGVLIGWLNLVDSDAGKLANYRLTLQSSSFSLTSPFCGLVAEFCHAVFLLISAHAVALMGAILNPDAWLEPLSNLYSTVTAKIYGVFPPIVLAIGAFSILAFLVFARRGPAGSAVQVSKAQWERISSGVLLLALIGVVASNPFWLIQEALGGVLAFAGFLTGSGDVGVGGNVGSSLVDSIRSLTLLINYGSTLDAECARAWSESMNAGGSNPLCLGPEQLSATSANPVTALLGVLAVAWAVGLMYFAVVVVLLILNEVTLWVAYLSATVYLASGAMLARRPFDPLGRVLASAAVHGVLALGFWFIAGLGPGLLILIVTQVLSFLPVWIQILLMSVVYFYSAKLLRAILANKENLFKLFRSRIEASKQWNALYSQNNSTTVLGTALEGTWAQPKQWARDQYASVKDRWNGFVSAGGQKGAAMTSTGDGHAVLPDSPEQLAAFSRADTYVAPAAQGAEVITGNDVASSWALGRVLGEGAATAGNEKVVAIDADGRATVGRPAEAADLEAGAAPAAVGQLAPIFFRGGIAQLASPIPPLPTGGAPVAAPRGAEQQAAGAGEHFEAAMSRHWQQAEARNRQLQGEIAALNGRLTTTADAVEVGTARFDGSGAYGLSRPPEVVSAPSQGSPGLRSILDTAARAQRLVHNRNLLRARGVAAPVTISDEDEAVPELMFAVDRAGRNRVEPREGVGFGDAI